MVNIKNLNLSYVDGKKATEEEVVNVAKAILNIVYNNTQSIRIATIATQLHNLEDVKVTKQEKEEIMTIIKNEKNGVMGIVIRSFDELLQ